mgnify:CR=1 FL=1
MDIYADRKAVSELNSIYSEAVYGQSAGQKLAKREKDDDAAGAPYTVTAADKKGNTPAYQGLKAGKKNVKTGKPLYKAADHLKNESYETKKKEEVLSAMKRQGRKLSDKDKDKIANKVVTSKGDTSKSDDRYAYEETVVKKELKDLQKGIKGLKGKEIEKADKIAEEDLKEKESYKTVAAVIDYDRSKKGTDDATYDSEHGEKEKAKKERDYAAWERSKMKKDDPNWKHKKGSTSESYSSWRDDLREVLVATEKEDETEVTEKKVKNKVVIDPKINIEQVQEKRECCAECGSYTHTTAEHKDAKLKETILWDKVSLALTELGEMNEVQFKVVKNEV